MYVSIGMQVLSIGGQGGSFPPPPPPPPPKKREGREKEKERGGEKERPEKEEEEDEVGEIWDYDNMCTSVIFGGANFRGKSEKALRINVRCFKFCDSNLGGSHGTVQTRVP